MSHHHLTLEGYEERIKALQDKVTQLRRRDSAKAELTSWLDTLGLDLNDLKAMVREMRKPQRAAEPVKSKNALQPTTK